jgi:glycosyltransferase involved in cell wall biosynthesis
MTYSSPQSGWNFRVLFAHNAYQHCGGEDLVAESEIALLHAYGHEVVTYTRSNDDIEGMRSLILARQALWSEVTIRELGALIERFQPDLIHAHNTFPLISPSLYWVAVRHGIPVVQTLHNFRLLCAQAMFLRNEQVCEDCLGHLPWRGMTRRCYRGSFLQSGLLVAMLGIHRALGTYSQKVARYIALNDFCRDKFIAGGLPAERVMVKPNFVDVVQPLRQPVSNRFLFVGRLSAEKGLKILAAAAMQTPDAVFEVVGDGPAAADLNGVRNVERRGPLPLDAAMQAMTRATCLLMPSLCYENFPRTLVEAFALGLPVIASRLGALAELIRDGETGLLFKPGDPADLASKVQWAMANPDAMRRMGEAARREYEAKYTPDVNYRQLMAIYQDAIDEVKGRGR